jgi:hypothetical protein
MNMTTSWPLLALLSFVPALILVRRAYRRHLARQAAQGLNPVLDSCRQLLALVVNLQQHRGMSSAWLSGDASFLPRLRQKQQQIEALFPPLMQAARCEAERHVPCFVGNDVALFAFRWRNLVDTLDGKSAEQSIAEHSHMIALVLDWLSALGEARIEPLAAEVGEIGRARNFAYRLPALAESLGQARAIGTGVAARRGCSPVARVRLMFLVGRAEALLEQAMQANDGGEAAKRVRSSLQAMARTVRTSMLLSDGVRVSPDEYFSVVTQVIDAVIAWIEHSGQLLKSLAADNGHAVKAASPGA